MQKRGAYSGQTGLGDFADLFYSVPITVGTTKTSVNLDTGSSDLWVATSDCLVTSPACTASNTLQAISSKGLKLPAGLTVEPSVNLLFGDSKTGTHASGPVNAETAAIAGLSLGAQVFAAVNDTDSSAIYGGSSGILGMGFFSASQVQAAVVNDKFNSPQTTDQFIESAATYGPLTTRLALSGQLEQPMFALMLQRNTIDVSGDDGVVSVGCLPDGIDNSSLTWLPVRLYAPADGGLNPPTFAPDEVYPLRWEVELDAVYFDGKQVENNAGGGVTALIDTGNSILRGPDATVSKILSAVSPSAAKTGSPTFPCADAHTVSFQLGGQNFPVDPRDFVAQNQTGDAETCVASRIVSTDAPSSGSLFSWSLGDPFFRSNLVAFYYGNLTHPSVDPPRIGFLNMVNANASAELADAVSSAKANGGNFESTSQAASTATAGAQSLSTKQNVATSTSAPVTETATINVAPASAITTRSEGVNVASATTTPTTVNTTTNTSGAGRVRHSAWMVMGPALWALCYML
ncbi:acid protease [Peniophora sp. CONT]|nr:acid protease [Peniophora sp. CONT]